MNNIQKLINELEAEKEKAFKLADQAIKQIETKRFYMFNGKEEAFSYCIQKLTLLLNSENEAEKAANFSNPMGDAVRAIA
jgi:hypothetical protein